MHARTTTGHLICLFALLSTSAAWGQTGVSDDRVSLPEGPGSLEGVGENVGINTNMGSMTYNVAVKVPTGFAGVTPNLGLSYSSAGSESLLGVGWSMPIPSIERMTFKRLPRYERDDDFAANGSDQLVLLPGTNPPVYRSRYEGGFVRYTWMEAGDGAEGYWLAEYPDGTKGTFGATMDGTLVPEARVGDPGLGTFKYMLVDKVDVYGHRMTTTYQKFGNYSLPTSIGYVYNAQDNPTYQVDLVYNERMDDGGTAYISVADGGFNLLLTQRLARIDVLSRGQRIRAYRLSYEPYASSGGFTRLTRVEQVGAENGTYPIQFGFEYSQALGGECDGDDCEQPFTIDMGSIGVTLASGAATLVDINGDALPDVLDTSQPGAHRFFLNVANEVGTSSFNTDAVNSAIGRQDTHRLGAPGTQILDVNGDGYADLLNASTGAVLLNKGTGDWADDADALDATNLAEALIEDFDPGEGGLQDLRFIDFNNDKKIDLMKASRAQTLLYENMGDSFDVLGDVTTLDVGFSEDKLQLADMNGDGQLDLVKVQLNSLRYRINYGWGRWSDWFDITGLPIGEGQIEIAELEDINGDALADLVVVSGESVTYALNNNSTNFDAPITLTSADVNGDIPNRGSEVTVLYADMNANGSSDVVWIGPSGQVDVLELFPVRPNLLTKITNEIGQVTDIEYGTIAAEMARDGGAEAWSYRLPYPMNVVKRLDRYDLLTDLHEITEYTYHDGFYDGVEKQFRGFERVETKLLGDETIEEGLTEETFDVGFEDPYRNGLLLSSRVMSGGEPINETHNVYGDCPVAEIPEGTAYPIRHTCQLETRNLLKERTDSSEWVTLMSRMTYDGYGNVTLDETLGVVGTGPDGEGACGSCGGRDADEFGAPCGTQCVGDEVFTETEYVEPGEDTNGRWITGAPFRVREYGRDGSELVRETLTYYDGDAFVGLPLGQLDQGNVSRVTVTKEVGSDDVITLERYRYDDHGNVVETIDPLGEPGGDTRRRLYVYDAENLRTVQADIVLTDNEGNPYRLRRELQYEPRFDMVFEATAWLRVVDDQIVSTYRGYAYEYDEFGRLISQTRPGNTTETPDEIYTYELSSPVSRVITEKNFDIGGAYETAYIQCFDGRGRLIQTRTRLNDTSYQVSGFTRFNLRSAPVEEFQPYTSATEGCDEAPPEGTLATRTRYDATGRPLEVTAPDAAIYGAASTQITVYGPLRVEQYDPEDSDMDSPYANTPNVMRYDGNGTLVSFDRTLTPNEAATTTLHFDSLGRLTGYTDPGGNRKEQFYDLVNRVVRIIDPNSADETTFEYNDASNLVRRTDDRGVTVVTEYDGANRPIALYDLDNPDATRITMRYDAAPEDCVNCTHPEGQLAAITYPALNGEQGQDLLGYDVRGRNIWTGRALAGVSFETRLTYDNADRITSTTYPDGRTIAHRYDTASRPTGLGDFLAIDYTERSLVATIESGDGTTTTSRFDDVMRLMDVRTENPDGAVLQGFSYSYDRVGNLQNVADLSELDDAPQFDAEHTYDAWYRVTSSRYGDGSETLDFDFDVIDNITSITSSLGEESLAHVGELSYDSFAPNAVTEAKGLIIGYDAAGNVTERGEQRYAWDWLNRMTSVTEGDETIARFVYGGKQSRIAKIEGDSTTLYTGPTFEVRDGISSLYLTLNTSRRVRIESDALAADLLPDENDDGVINAADALLTSAGGGESGPSLWSSVRRLLMETGPDDGVTFLHNDHLGSITLATGEVDGEHAVFGHRNFNPLGTERDDSWGYVDEYGFTGQEIDRSTGLIHFDHRYYDPVLGRWLSIDPAFATSTVANVSEFGEGTTAYNYVAGNFMNSIDPTGLTTKGKKSRMGKKLKGIFSKRRGARKKAAKAVDKTFKKYESADGTLAPDRKSQRSAARRKAKSKVGSLGDAVVSEIGSLKGPAAERAASMITALQEEATAQLVLKYKGSALGKAESVVGDFGGKGLAGLAAQTVAADAATDMFAVEMTAMATGEFFRDLDYNIKQVEGKLRSIRDMSGPGEDGGVIRFVTKYSRKGY